MVIDGLQKIFFMGFMIDQENVMDQYGLDLFVDVQDVLFCTNFIYFKAILVMAGTSYCFCHQT